MKIHVLAGSGTDLAGGWKKLWDALSQGWPGLATLMTVVGVGLLVITIITWLYNKRRGGGGNNSGLIWVAILAMVLAGPALIIPAILTIFDWLAGILLNLLKIQ